MSTSAVDCTATLCKRCGTPVVESSTPCPGCSESSQALSPQEVIGPYRVTGPLGAGPRGATYLCLDEARAEQLSVKVLANQASEDGMREARRLGHIAHQNLVAVRSVGHVRGAPFIASEYVLHSLEELTAGQGPRGAREAILLTRAAAIGLEAAWQSGIAHGRIKPTNVYLSHDGFVKVGDFRLHDRAGDDARDRPRSAEDDIYEAPELATQPADDRSDIYALGVFLFHLLTGTLPMDRDDSGARAVPPVTDVTPDLHAAFIPLLGRMTAADRSLRHRSYTELIAELDEILSCLAFGDRIRLGLGGGEAPVTGTAADDPTEKAGAGAHG